MRIIAIEVTVQKSIARPNQQDRGLLMNSIVPLKPRIMRGSLLCSTEWMTYSLTAYVNGRVTLPQFDLDPIQPLMPRRLWPFYVGEFGSRCEDDLVVERRGAKPGLGP